VKRIASIGLALVVVCAATAAAQLPTPAWAPPARSHIRGYVMRPDSVPLDAWILQYRGNLAELGTCLHCDVTVIVPIDSIQSLEIARERSNMTVKRFLWGVGKGTLIGAAIGAGLGLVLIVGPKNCANDSCELLPLIPIGGAILGGGIGVVGGVLHGLLQRAEYWEPVRRY